MELNLDDIAYQNIEKLKSRQDRGFCMAMEIIVKWINFILKMNVLN